MPSVDSSGVEQYPMRPIARVHSCYQGKFGIPRQSGLIPEAKGEIRFISPFNQENVIRGLESFSHIWVLFIFHLSIREHWKATVRPPRLGGDTRVGVFASRSPFRPNPIGLSAMKLEGIVKKPGLLALQVSGLDLLDGTPVLDIKPYLPYADILPNAVGGFAPTAPEGERLSVAFVPEAEAYCQQLEAKGLENFREMARKIIAANPRPAYQDLPGKEYTVFLSGYELRFYCEKHQEGETGQRAIVTSIRPQP